MTDRISDERIDDLMAECALYAEDDDSDRDSYSAFEELQRFRKLESGLLALAERIEEAERGNVPTISPRQWARRLRSLLAAHDRPSEATET